ncbi:hypothetical protein JZK55_23630 [Dissulfurispira thermophila]|uniref:Uncharacterized protein n=2 Tax=root TaxID=1 RepID=A0A7G1H5P1_9BACT|nr:hypothetical protein [Dissulfurispira thermophila]BCB97441.1 hypothetical protein JZK55_23630 [Dissulfurispira thermophila]
MAVDKKEIKLKWISGKKASHIIANILSHLAEKERDIKCLAEEALNKYKELTMLYTLNEKMTMSLEHVDYF